MNNKRFHKIHLSYKTKRRIIFGMALLVVALLFIFRNLSFLILSLSAIAFLVMFYMGDHLFDIRFKTRHYYMAIFIAVASFLLYNLYSFYAPYDKILHFVQPILVSALVFHMALELKVDLKWKLVFTFFVVTGLVGMFEIGEYVLDLFFDLNLQGVVLRGLQEFGEELVFLQAPIDDTMIDMSLGVLGSVVYVVYILIFHRGRVKVKK